MAVSPPLAGMTSAEAKRLIIVGTVGAGVLSAVALYRRGETPSPRIAVGVIGAGVILAALAEVTPGMAGAFGLIMLMTAMFVVGGDAWAGVTQAATGKPPKAASSAASTPSTERRGGGGSF